MIRSSRALTALLLWLIAVPAAGQSSVDLTQMSLQDLLNVEILSASKFPQEIGRAPASITIITADEIRRFGYRTLADVLRSVRGLYVSDDRNYSYLGVRGFSRPGDYNSRVLLLLDGHRFNDPIYEQAPIGTDLPIDIEAIERVEIIRGPGSSLYGTNALFGIVNVVTRTGEQETGVRVDTEAGSLSTIRGRVSVGDVFDNGVDVLVTASLYNTSGMSPIYFPEFDTPETAHGLARDADGDQTGRLFGKISFGRMTIRGAYTDRVKYVPTASFGSVFGSTEERTVDTRRFADVSYAAVLGHGWSGTVRGSYDAYHYNGKYPFAEGSIFQDFSLTDWLGTEFTANRRVHGRHFVTVGAEGRYALRQDQYSMESGETTIQDRRRSGTWGVYVQDEFSLRSNLVLYGGARVDHYGTFGQEITPRTALVYHPAPATAIKIMHGRAFRAPNAYELYYFTASRQDPSRLRPETIRTTETTWEQMYGRTLRSTVSAFRSDMRDLISEVGGGDDFLNGSYFTNNSSVRSTGIETEVEARLANGVQARGSYVYAVATDARIGGRLSNSPRHLSKYILGLPVPHSALFLGLEGTHTSSRLSPGGEPVGGAYLQHLTVTTDRLFRRADASIGVYNVFDRHYGDPGSQEHALTQIPQEGRTLRATLTVRF
jgi:outer membrane receptor for ferrienterochelin and colicins